MQINKNLKSVLVLFLNKFVYFKSLYYLHNYKFTVQHDIIDNKVELKWPASYALQVCLILNNFWYNIYQSREKKFWANCVTVMALIHYYNYIYIDYYWIWTAFWYNLTLKCLDSRNQKQNILNKIDQCRNYLQLITLWHHDQIFSNYCIDYRKNCLILLLGLILCTR